MYLSSIKIEKYKGIEEIETEFDPKINIIIGENGSSKSGLIDAIRLLYNIGEPIRELSVSKDDFHQKKITTGAKYRLDSSYNCNYFVCSL